jgi:hypothetical protein
MLVRLRLLALAALTALVCLATPATSAGAASQDSSLRPWPDSSLRPSKGEGTSIVQLPSANAAYVTNADNEAKQVADIFLEY